MESAVYCTANRVLIVMLSVLCVSSAASAWRRCGPREYRVWQLQDYHMAHIKRLINLASERGVNRIQLSHNIVMDSEEILNSSRRAEDINCAVRWAHEKGIKVDIWTHELNGVPDELLKDGKANLDDPKLWEWLREKYARVFRLCPDIDGLVLTMQETAMSIYHERSVTSSIPPEQRVAKLIDSIADVCKSLRKDLFVRTFSYEPSELKFICDGLKLSTAEIIVMTKCQPHDWQPFYPDNPAIGDVGDHPQIVEFDLGYEFLGLSRIPYIDLEYLARRLSHGMSRDIEGAVLRVERLDWRATDTPNWATIEIFTRMLLNPCLDRTKAYRQWLEARYGKNAVPHLQSAFSRTFDIVNKSYFVLGGWITNHSILPDYGYATASLERRATAKWDPSQAGVKQELLSPTDRTVSKISLEKEEAVRLARASLEDIRSAKPHLKERDFADLEALFERTLTMATVWKAHYDLYFAIRLYERQPSEAMAYRISRLADALQRLRDSLATDLIALAASYKRPNNDANIRAINAMLTKAEETLKRTAPNSANP